MTYRADIDGLRAIAILLVTVFHFDLFSVGKAGFIGVDVFFVISGFLITGIILRALEEGRFHFGTFLYRRVRRLYPALIATLVLYLMAGAVLMLPDRFEELALEALLSQLYVINFYFWQTVNYFGLRVDAVPLLHMWSLAVEEQFYLIFPLVCLVIWRFAPKALIPLMVLGALVSFALGYLVTPRQPMAAFYLLPTRAWELLAGSLLFVMLRDRTLPPPLAWVLGPLGLGLIGWALYIHTPATGVPGSFALLPVGGAMCLIAGGLSARAPVTQLVSSPPFVWIGLISYPLYLVHWPVLILLKDTVLEFTLVWKLFGFALSFVLAWAIYRWIETPIRTSRALPRPGWFLTATALISALLVALTFGAWFARGVPQRFAPEVTQTLALREDRAVAHRGCADTLGSAPCILGDPAATPDLLILGDSHANAFAAALSGWLAREGRAAYFSFSPGCLPVRGFGQTRCTVQADTAPDFLKAQPQVRAVMLVSIWRQPYEAGLTYNGSWVSGETAAARFAEQLEADTENFRALGRDVILVEPFFAAPANVPRRMAKNLAFGHDWPIDTLLSVHEETFAALTAAFDQAAAAGALRLSLIEDFCTGGICRSTHDGRPLFTDTNHIAQTHSDFVSRIIERQMQALKP